MHRASLGINGISSDVVSLFVGRWSMDGNFAIAPRLFQQLYVIRAPLGTLHVNVNVNVNIEFI